MESRGGIMSYIKRNCDYCGKEYKADTRNLNRGWGLCCSKSCAAKKREKSKKGYDSERVKDNNIRRATWNVNLASCRINKRKTIEGYDIINGVAYDEFGEAVYNVKNNANLGNEYHCLDAEGLGQS